MIYQNVELYNVSEITETGDGSVQFHRFPVALEEAFLDQGRKMNTSTTGVEIRFRMKDTPVTLRLRNESATAVCPVYIYQGGVIRESKDMNYVRYIQGSDVNEIVIPPVDPAEREKFVCAQASGQFPYDIDLVRLVICNGRVRFYGAEGCEPPRPEDVRGQKYLAYGSSITHGATSLVTPYSYVSLTAEALRLDGRNLGMAGACRLEHEVADYIAEEGRKGNWDVATLCLGINVLSWETEKIEERVDYMLRTVAGANPEKHIFLISPIYCGDDYKQEGKAARWRTIIERQVKEYASPFVHYVDGLSLLDGAWGLSGDRVHPAPIGVLAIAQSLAAQMKPFVCNTKSAN